MNRGILFAASCVALIATAMSFAIRNDIMAQLEADYVIPHVTGQSAEEWAAADSAAEDSHERKLIKTYLGLIGTVAFFSFGLAIFFGGPLVDLLGMGLLLRVAALCHIGGALLTIMAPNYWVVVLATLVVGAGNGLVEAVCNPLIATVYPEEKTHKLTIFHAWFPGGIVIGGLLAYGFSKIGLGWQLKMALILVPAIIYAVMILKQEFPATERVAAGVSFKGMFSALLSPLFLLLFIMMWLTASSELGPGTWIPNIYKDVMGREEGILALVWGSALMYVLRQFFSKPVHRFSPALVIGCSAPLAAIGLFMFRFANTPLLFFTAATLLYIGVCFWWPTMLGITSERCPKTGALGLAIIGGTGSISTFFAGPVMGWLNDMYGPQRTLQLWSILPVAICVVFVALYAIDRSRGGYKAERLVR